MVYGVGSSKTETRGRLEKRRSSFPPSFFQGILNAGGCLQDLSTFMRTRQEGGGGTQHQTRRGIKGTKQNICSAHREASCQAHGQNNAGFNSAHQSGTQLLTLASKESKWWKSNDEEKWRSQVFFAQILLRNLFFSWLEKCRLDLGVAEPAAWTPGNAKVALRWNHMPERPRRSAWCTSSAAVVPGCPPPPRRPCSATNRRNAQYLDFLCVLCLCEGAPITRNQDVICQQLLKKKAHVLLPMQRQQGQVCGPRPLLGRESRIGNQAFFLHHPNSTAKVNSTVKGLCPPSSFINRLSQPPAQSLDQPIGCGDGVCVWVAVMCWPKVGWKAAHQWRPFPSLPGLDFGLANGNGRKFFEKIISQIWGAQCAPAELTVVSGLY